jgi:hypothetical protein
MQSGQIADKTVTNFTKLLLYLSQPIFKPGSILWPMVVIETGAKPFRVTNEDVVVEPRTVVNDPEFWRKYIRY